MYIATETVKVGEVKSIYFLQVKKLGIFPIAKSKSHFVILRFLEQLLQHKLVLEGGEDQRRAGMHKLIAVGSPVTFLVDLKNLPCLT